MTTIVHHKGLLIGDRKQVAMTTPTSFHDGPKVFTSYDGTFAYGFSGDAIHESSRTKLEEVIRGVIQRSLLEPAAGTEVLPAEGKVMTGLSVGIVVTKYNVWIFNAIRSTMTDIDKHTHGCGTGGGFLASLLTCGMPLEQAMVTCARFDPLSGSNMDVIKVEDLKEFIIKLEVAK